MTAPPEVPLGRPRVLIVDDERQNRQLLEVMLKPEGFLVVSAADGEEALAVVAKQPPDLILLDVMMPGMDGYQVVRRIKANAATRDIPVILVTALKDREARLEGLSAGAEDFISKPVDRAELTARVRNLARLKSSSDDKHAQRLEGAVGRRTAALVSRTQTLEEQAAVLTEQAALLDLAQDAIVVRDLESQILFWSQGAEVMYGWSSEEALGKNEYDLLQTEFSEPPADIEAALLGEDHWEGEVIHHKRDGTPVAVASRWALQRDAAGAPFRILTLGNDITARQRADAELLLLSERLSLATAVAKVGVWEWDLTSNLLTWDATMFDIYGIPPQALMPYDQWAAAVAPEDLPAVEAGLRKAIADKSQGSAEYRIILPDGSTRTVSAVERVVLDERGKVSRVIGVDMDVTERKRAEQALEQLRADQLRFKDDFLTHVSHELRSPLTAIKQFTSILLGGLAGELNPEQREYQEIVLKNIHQLQSMVDDLLTVTRLETGKLTIEPECISVADALTDSLHTLEGTARAKGISLSFELPPDLPPAYADETRLRQILIILLDNAIKFTPADGSVSVHARISPDDPRFLLIDVSDTGCGISPETSARIFERLYQASDRVHASRKGLGLGLYICKELVTRQGGRITLTSSATGGTTFSFTVPVFSLNNSIASLLRNETWPAATVALVVVETRPLGPWPSKEFHEAWSHEARGLLQRCLLPDLDVLLPKLNVEIQGERFFVAAFADPAGASVLANRIKGQFERLLEMKGAGLTLSVSHTMLPPWQTQPGISTETIVAQMAANLQKAILSYVRKEKDHHE